MPDTIAVHASKLRAPYRPSPKAPQVIASAKHLAKLVLSSSELIEPHKRKILSEVQWLISEADGKYATRYRSKAVVELATNTPTSTVKVNHEHIFGRGEFSRALLAHPELADQLLDGVTGCVVTKEEHDKLPQHLHGWDKYNHAKIVVLDMSTSPPTVVAGAA
jgi:hypothetical protein